MNKSSLKWAGSKRNMMPRLKSVLAQYEYDVFVEPFFGAGNVSLNIDANRYILADYNKDLVNYHNVVIEYSPSDVVAKLESLFSRYDEEFYYRARELFNSGNTDDLTKAALFQYLNKHGFNGLCRYNLKGKYNVPFGKKSAPTAIPKDEIEFFHNRFRGCRVQYQSFEDTITQAPIGSLIYCDPPYVPLDTSKSVVQYTSSAFNFDTQRYLKQLCKDSDNVCVISNHSSEFSRELYSDADELIEISDVRRTISAGTRSAAKELIAIYK